MSPVPMTSSPLSSGVLVLPEPSECAAACAQCRIRDDVVWQDDLVRVLVSGPIGLPYVARVVPRAHLAEPDLDGHLRRRINRVLKRVKSALADDPEISGFEFTDTGIGAQHVQVVAMARPPVGLHAPDTSLAFLDDMLPAVPDDVLRARTARVVAALDIRPLQRLHKRHVRHAH